jgi:hypothetical protein
VVCPPADRSEEASSAFNLGNILTRLRVSSTPGDYGAEDYSTWRNNIAPCAANLIASDAGLRDELGAEIGIDTFGAAFRTVAGIPDTAERRLG